MFSKLNVFIIKNVNLGTYFSFFSFLQNKNKPNLIIDSSKTIKWKGIEI